MEGMEENLVLYEDYCPVCMTPSDYYYDEKNQIYTCQCGHRGKED